MVLGIYYLTMENPNGKGKGMLFASPEEAIRAYEEGVVDLQAPVKVRVIKEIDGVTYNRRLDTTVGRVIFNQAIHQDLEFVERKTPEQMLDLEINQIVPQKLLRQILDRTYRIHGGGETAVVLDRVKDVYKRQHINRIALPAHIYTQRVAQPAFLGVIDAGMGVEPGLDSATHKIQHDIPVNRVIEVFVKIQVGIIDGPFARKGQLGRCV